MRVAVLCIMIPAIPILAGEIGLDFTLSPGSVETGSWQGWDWIYLEEGSVATPVGTPGLPGIGYAFVIPQGTTVNRVEVSITGTGELPGLFDILPVQYFPLSGELEAPAGNPEVYGSDDSQEKFVSDFVQAWDKVMNLDRFEL